MVKQNKEFWSSPIGGNWAYWGNMARSIGDFIRANKLAPAVIVPIAARQKRSSKIIDLGIRGGIRVAHLHFRDKVYMLDAEQWAQFSGGIIANSKARLAGIKKVSFEQAVVLGSAVQTLGRG